MEKQLSKKLLTIVFGGFVALGALTGIACDDDDDENIPVTTGTGGHGGSNGFAGSNGFGGSGGGAGFGGSGGAAGGAGSGATDGGGIY